MTANVITAPAQATVQAHTLVGLMGHQIEINGSFHEIDGWATVVPSPSRINKIRVVTTDLLVCHYDLGDLVTII